MSIKSREYLLSIDRFSEPGVVKESTAIGLLLSRIIMMDKGSDPLHPDMGVGIKQYRYGLNNLNDLKQEIERQLSTYLPELSEGATVAIIVTPDKTCNIEIKVGDTVYVYESDKTSVPITLEDLNNS